MNNTVSIIGVEDSIAKRLVIALEAENFQPHVYNTAEKGVQAAAKSIPDLIVLGMQDRATAIDVIRNLRYWFNNPILVISAANDEQEVIAALDHGANDYMHLPLHVPEALARIRSALRWKKTANKSIDHHGRITIDFMNRLVKLDNHFLKLSPLEYNLLSLLIRSAGRIATTSYLTDRLWGEEFPDAIKDLRVHIMRLRKKIEKDPKHPAIIITEPKIGYKFISTSEL